MGTDLSDKSIYDIRELLENTDKLLNDIGYNCFKGLTTIPIARDKAGTICQCKGKYESFNKIYEEARKYILSDAVIDVEMNRRLLINIDEKIGYLGDCAGESYAITDDSEITIISNENNKLVFDISAINDSGYIKQYRYTIEKHGEQWYITDEQGYPDFTNENANLIIYKTNQFSSTSSTPQVQYKAEYVLDGNTDTTWAEGAKGDGIGEWIMLTSDINSEVRGIEIANGYTKSEETYFENNRLKKIKIEFSDNDSIIVNLKDDVHGYDTLGLQNIKFENSVITKRIKISILEVYPGSKFKDTCISEIRVY